MPITLKGKTYYTVAERITAFREIHPIADGWGIITKVIHADDKSVMIRAAIVNPQGVEVAADYAEEQRTSRGVNSASALENGCTSSIGRALAAAGFGGGGEYASADELTRALEQRGQPQPQPQRNGSPQPRPATDADRREFAQSLLDTLNLPAGDVLRWLDHKGEQRPVTVQQHAGLFAWLRDRVGEDCRDWIRDNPPSK